MTTNITGAYPNDPNSLVYQLVNSAATLYPSDTDEQKLYLTKGASPGALGLQRANEILQSASSSASTRERVVIFFTDGLLNVNLNGQRSSRETVAANAGDPSKPIDQAKAQAELIKTSSKPATIYMIAMGNGYAQIGLNEMSSDPEVPFFQPATNPDILPQLLSSIGNDVIYGECNPAEADWTVPNVSDMFNANGSLLGNLGIVVAKDQGGNVVGTSTINSDGTWSVPNLQPNTNYKISFSVAFYRGADSLMRQYSLISNPEVAGNTPGIADDITVRISDTGVSYTQSLNGPVRLLLNGSVCPTS
jgi:hypothetical protein